MNNKYQGLQRARAYGMSQTFARISETVTIEGLKHLGAALGSRTFLKEFVGEKVDEWVNEVTKLADFASSLLCSLHFWSAAPLDVFPKNITG